MQIKGQDPRQLAAKILERSSCTIKVGAVLVDRKGNIFSWGQNHMGFDGFGQCAEAHAILRAMLRRTCGKSCTRFKGATIYVAGLRARNRKVLCSKPCPRCQALLDRLGIKACYRDADSRWWRYAGSDPSSAATARSLYKKDGNLK